MMIWTCWPCEQGNHKACFGTKNPPAGMYGGSKCVCSCQSEKQPEVNLPELMTLTQQITISEEARKVCKFIIEQNDLDLATHNQEREKNGREVFLLPVDIELAINSSREQDKKRIDELEQRLRDSILGTNRKAYEVQKLEKLLADANRGAERNAHINASFAKQILEMRDGIDKIGFYCAGEGKFDVVSKKCLELLSSTPCPDGWVKREQHTKALELLNESSSSHKDHHCADYSECDISPCQFCTEVKALTDARRELEK